MGVREPVGEERVAGADGRPLALGRGRLLVESVEPGSHLAKLGLLPGRLEVVVQGLTGLAHPELVGVGGDFLQHSTPLGIPKFEQVAAQHEAGPCVSRVPLEHGAKERHGSRGTLQLVG